MRVLLFLPAMLLAFNLFGQDFCTPGFPSDEPDGCIPCGGIMLYLPSGDTVEYNAIYFISDSLKQDTTQYDFPCGTVEKGAWFTYFADKDGAISFSFFQNFCYDSTFVDQKADFKIGLFDKDLNLITCSVTDSSFMHSGLAPNQQVQVLLDAVMDKTCIAALQFDHLNIASRPEPISKINASAETNAFCITEEICFSVDPVNGASGYDWSPPKNTTVVSGGQSTDTEICVRFESLGIDTVRVAPFNLCKQGDSVIRTFGVYDFNASPGNISTTSGSIFCEGTSVCFEFQPENLQSDFVWVTPENFEIQQGGGTSETTVCGQVLDSGNGFIEVGVRPIDGCNQAILRTPIEPIIPTTVLPTIFVCRESFPIEVQGQLYEVPGTYSIIRSSVNGCDSVISFRIRRDVLMNGVFDEFICPNDTCIQIGDSCYARSPNVIMVDRPFPLCDSTVVLTPRFEVFDELNCNQSNNNIIFDWKLLELADAYAVNINGVLDTVSTNQFIVDQLSSDSLLQFSVQPIGRCAFPEVLSVTCNFDITSSQDHFVNSKIKILPNPSGDEVFLETDLKIKSVEIYDLAGQLLEQKNDTSFSLKKYGIGLYIFKIKTEEGVGVKRVVIQ